MTALRLLLLSLALAAPNAPAQTTAEPTAAEIMARVAANQDRAQSDRAHYVYLQHAHVISRKGNTVMCEETTDSRITPSDTGSQAALLKLDGRVLLRHKYQTYTTLQTNDGKAMVENGQDSVNISIGDDDRELVENMRANLTRGHSKDGLNEQLFPLTSKAQADYAFHLAGRERMNGRDVFHVEFTPKDKSDFGWKGDAYIDVAAWQPVVVNTVMSRNIPVAVRTMLGTSIPGLGFSVTYAPQVDGVWFPVSFGTEFKIHILFFFNRNIVIAAQNRDFEKAHVTAKIIDNGEQ